MDEVARWLEGPPHAALLDRPRNPPVRLLLAQETEDSEQVAYLGAIDHVGVGNPCPGHAQVERAVPLEGKAALGLVDLHGGDADIQYDAVEPFDRRMIGKIGELRMNKGQMPSARLDHPLSAGNGGRIAIKSNDTGTGLKDRCRIDRKGVG